jgi:hypothetical protein
MHKQLLHHPENYKRSFRYFSENAGDPPPILDPWAKIIVPRINNNESVLVSQEIIHNI